MRKPCIRIFNEGEIDAHDRRKHFERAIELLEENKEINQTNKKLILDFIRDCQLGKTIKKKSKKSIGPARCLKYLTILRQLSYWFGISFDNVTQEDMETFIFNLENNKIRTVYGRQYSEATKLDIKNTIRKFWKWKDGKNSVYPELVDWIGTFIKPKDVLSISKEEVETLIEHTADPRNKALLIVLFDSGARINELLNVRLKREHIFWKEDLGCFMIRLEYSKTRSRTISIPLSTKYLEYWLKNHPAREDSRVQLFPMSYANIRMTLNRLGKRILKKRITAHLLRHSSATYYANRLSRYQLCYRYGWAMSSDMPDRYIDREGLSEADTAKKVQVDEIAKAKTESLEIREEFTLLKESHSELLKVHESVLKELNSIKSGKGLLTVLLPVLMKQKKMEEVLEGLKGREFDVVLKSSDPEKEKEIVHPKGGY